jgi:hypothetical protein
MEEVGSNSSSGICLGPSFLGIGLGAGMAQEVDWSDRAWPWGSVSKISKYPSNQSGSPA